MGATVRVPEPEALFARGDDSWVLGCVAPRKHWRHAEPRFSYGFQRRAVARQAAPAVPGQTTGSALEA